MAKSKTDAQMTARLKREAPEALEAEVDFDALVVRVVTVDPGSVGIVSKRRKGRVRARSRAKPKPDPTTK